MNAGHKAHILIVDDRRETARTIRAALEDLHRSYVIADVPSGEEAMLEFQRITFDLMITEARLPGISGLELIKRVLLQSPGLPIILTTSQGISVPAFLVALVVYTTINTLMVVFLEVPLNLPSGVIEGLDLAQGSERSSS